MLNEVYKTRLEKTIKETEQILSKAKNKYNLSIITVKRETERYYEENYQVDKDEYLKNYKERCEDNKTEVLRIETHIQKLKKMLGEN